jgi:hypothetical protein
MVRNTDVVFKHVRVRLPSGTGRKRLAGRQAGTQAPTPEPKLNLSSLM